MDAGSSAKSSDIRRHCNCIVDVDGVLVSMDQSMNSRIKYFKWAIIGIKREYNTNL